MKFLITLLSLSLAIISCSHHKEVTTYKGRRIASNPLLRIFLSEVSDRSKKYTVRELEDQALKYIKKKSQNSAHGNWSQIGISDVQASKITSLYDDMPHMPKVRKWVMENITLITKVEQKVAKESFDVVNKSFLSFDNPYAFKSSQSKVVSNRTKISPFESINKDKSRVLNNVQSVGDSSASKELRSLLVDFQKRAAKEPAVFANGLEMVESAADITRKTGLKGAGKGCKEFNQKAAPEILEMKANVDSYRARLVMEQAEEKAQKYAKSSFKNYKELPVEARLTQQELDDITVKSFEDVLKYSNTEAKAAVRRLKRKPCQVY
ncbi:MAG: hypothetical protein N4A33_06900 [Bacteriovoracaceae bacterium]|jgi:hypothetical protein|nr:hypothetical protein [Bacteriovoracaceae bacterium]